MVRIEPFVYEKITAFKERVEIVSKLNEIIDYLNTAVYIDMDDVSDYVSDALMSYYTINQIDNIISDYYDKDEVNSLINAIKQFNITIVGLLPEVGDRNTVYLVPKIQSGNNNYEEYLYINGNWELIGQLSNIDLSDYVKGSGNIGTETKPIKIVNGQAVPITGELQSKIVYVNNPCSIVPNQSNLNVTQKYCFKFDKVIVLNLEFKSDVDISPSVSLFTISPVPTSTVYFAITNLSGNNNGAGFLYTSGVINSPITIRANNYYVASIVYMIN